MYSGVMRRTQIYLDDEESALLAQAAEHTGASRSELIRRAVRSQYGGEGPERRLAALIESAGSWNGRTGTGADYVAELRTNLADRLEQVGLQ